MTATATAMTRPQRVCTRLLLLPRVLSLLALALMLGSCVDATLPQHKDYDIVSVITEDTSNVVVARRNRVLYLLYDETIIGAEFDDPELRLQAAYPGFAIMQAAAYLDRRFTRAAQIGLGIGTVPSFLRAQGIPTDVIEISDAVVRQASDYFQYERCEPAAAAVSSTAHSGATTATATATDGDASTAAAADPSVCPHGATFVTDGLAFLQQTPASPRPYDLFIIDVYTGWNPVAFYVQEVMARVRDAWLRASSGVLVVNFVGLFNGPHAVVPKSIFRTLQAVFAHVQCYREMDNIEDDAASNIVFFASNEPFAFSVPTDGPFRDPDYNTYYYIVANFPKWEIFTDLKRDASVEVAVAQTIGAEEVTFETSVHAAPGDASLSSASAVATSAAARVLTRESHGAREFEHTHAFTQTHMRERVVAQFPASFWADVADTVSSSSSSSSSS